MDEEEHIITIKPKSSREYVGRPPSGYSVLYLASNPKDAERLALTTEYKAIQKCHVEAKKKLDTVFDIEPEELLDLLLPQSGKKEANQKILHFSGHGTGKNGLLFTGKNGYAALVKGDVLAEFLKNFKSSISCVVLNACHSEEQAKIIAEYIPNVIGVDKAIGDEKARAFSEAFYKCIFSGKSYKEAFKIARSQLSLTGHTGGAEMVMYCWEEKPTKTEPKQADPILRRVVPVGGSLVDRIWCDRADAYAGFLDRQGESSEERTKGIEYYVVSGDLHSRTTYFAFGSLLIHAEEYDGVSLNAKDLKIMLDEGYDYVDKYLVDSSTTDGLGFRGKKLGPVKSHIVRKIQKQLAGLSDGASSVLRGDLTTLSLRELLEKVNSVHNTIILRFEVEEDKPRIWKNLKSILNWLVREFFACKVPERMLVFISIEYPENTLKMQGNALDVIRETGLTKGYLNGLGLIEETHIVEWAKRIKAKDPESVAREVVELIHRKKKESLDKPTGVTGFFKKLRRMVGRGDQSQAWSMKDVQPQLSKVIDKLKDDKDKK